MNARDDKRWQQIRQIRERRQNLAAARATQAASAWRQRQAEAQRQDAEVREQAAVRQRHGAARRQTGAGMSAADWRDGHAWSGELQRRIDDGRRLALLAHAEAMQAQMASRAAQAGARRAAQDTDRAQQAIERAQKRAAAVAEQAEEQQIEDIAPARWWRGIDR